MTASPSSKQAFSTRNQYGSTQLSAVPAKPNLEIISSQGQLQVYSAPYRGSFPGVLSEALRSAGLGSKVLILQFLKGGVSQGVNNSIKLCGKLEWMRPEIYGCITSKQTPSVLDREDSINNKEAVDTIWNICKARLNNHSIDKLVLDEIGLAVEFGLIQEEDLINTLENRHDSIDVILTGPSIPTRVFSMADQVTQLRCSK